MFNPQEITVTKCTRCQNFFCIVLAKKKSANNCALHLLLSFFFIEDKFPFKFLKNGNFGIFSLLYFEGRKESV